MPATTLTRPAPRTRRPLVAPPARRTPPRRETLAARRSRQHLQLRDEGRRLGLDFARNPWALARQYNLSVIATVPSLLRERLGERLHACITDTGDPQATIFVNQLDPYTAQAYAVAYELAGWLHAFDADLSPDALHAFAAAFTGRPRPI